jgi:hypothetical protein
MSGVCLHSPKTPSWRGAKLKNTGATLPFVRLNIHVIPLSRIYFKFNSQQLHELSNTDIAEPDVLTTLIPKRLTVHDSKTFPSKLQSQRQCFKNNLTVVWASSRTMNILALMSKPKFRICGEELRKICFRDH